MLQLVTSNVKVQSKQCVQVHYVVSHDKLLILIENNNKIGTFFKKAFCEVKGQSCIFLLINAADVFFPFEGGSEDVCR